MNTFITDGRSGVTARVDSNSRLLTFSQVRSSSIEAAVVGNMYVITSGVVNLTSDNESAVLYIKNNDTYNWLVSRLAYSTGKSTNVGNKTDSTMKIIGNARNGTLITGGADSIAASANTGTANNLSVTVKVGGEGFTLEDGDPPFEILCPEIGQYNTPLNSIVIAPNTSLSFTFTPPVGNTDINVQVIVFVERDV